MALRLSTDLKRTMLSKLVDDMAGTCGTAGTGSLALYTGSQPASADDAASGTLLVTIAGIAWGGAAGATAATIGLASTSGYAGTAGDTGTVGWGRLEMAGTGYDGSAGTFRIDGDAGTDAACVFVLDVEALAAEDVVTLLTSPISL